MVTTPFQGGNILSSWRLVRQTDWLTDWRRVGQTDWLTDWRFPTIRLGTVHRSRSLLGGAGRMIANKVNENQSQVGEADRLLDLTRAFAT